METIDKLMNHAAGFYFHLAYLPTRITMRHQIEQAQNLGHTGEDSHVHIVWINAPSEGQILKDMIAYISGID